MDPVEVGIKGCEKVGLDDSGKLQRIIAKARIEWTQDYSALQECLAETNRNWATCAKPLKEWVSGAVFRVEMEFTLKSC